MTNKCFKKKKSIDKQARMKQYEAAQRNFNQYSRKWENQLPDLSSNRVMWKPLVGYNNAICLPDEYRMIGIK